MCRFKCRKGHYSPSYSRVIWDNYEPVVGLAVTVGVAVGVALAGTLVAGAVVAVGGSGVALAGGATCAVTSPVASPVASGVPGVIRAIAVNVIMKFYCSTTAVAVCSTSL